MTNQDEFLTVSDAAREASLSKDSIRDYVDKGKIKAVRTAGGIRLIPRAEVAKFVRERGRTGKI